MNSIKKQKKYLAENLIVESLRLYDTNKKDVEDFTQAANGDSIAKYLIESAWDADRNRDTKVFLVRDKNTREIAFYYALNCGILYKEYKKKDLTPVELELIQNYIEAVKRTNQKGLSVDQQDAANNLLNIALSDFYEKIEDSDRATYLLSLADDKIQIKDEKEEGLKETGESEHVKPVQETYPAIDIKFLCRNRNYTPKIQLDFKFGVYIFWEIIVPHILKISDLVGCKYVYLFAADNSIISTEEKIEPMPIMWTQDYDPYAEEDDGEDDEPKKESIRKLVEYYITELKFRPVSEYIILKPHFERDCYTLIQDVSELSSKRESVWLSHDVDNEMETYHEN